MGLKTTSQNRVRRALAPILEPGEDVVIALIGAAGINPAILGAVAGVTAYWALSGDLLLRDGGIGLLVAFLALVSLGVFLVKPRRLAVTDRRAILCHVDAFGRVDRVLAVDPLGAAAVESLRESFPQGSLKLRHSDGTVTRLWFPMFWATEARRVADLIGARKAPDSVPPRPD